MLDKGKGAVRDNYCNDNRKEAGIELSEEELLKIYEID